MTKPFLFARTLLLLLAVAFALFFLRTVGRSVIRCTPLARSVVARSIMSGAQPPGDEKADATMFSVSDVLQGTPTSYPSGNARWVVPPHVPDSSSFNTAGHTHPIAGRPEVVHTRYGAITVTVFGDRSKSHCLAYHEVGLNHRTCFQSLIVASGPQSLLLKNYCIVFVDAPGCQVRGLSCLSGLSCLQHAVCQACLHC